MLQEMEDCGRALSEDDICSLEAGIKALLPSPYRTFLLRCNGGCPTPNAYPIVGLANNPFGIIQEMFGIDCDAETSNLDWNYQTYLGRIPSNLLPIACDDGGNLICLSLSGDDAGAVVYWDHEHESDEPSYQNVYRIATGFNEFIDGLRELAD